MKRIVPHDPNWAQIYENEAKLVATLMGDAVRTFHHIGSTAIPDILAKPIIDVLLEVSSLQAVDDCAERLKEIGHEARGEHGIAGRRYFNRKPADAALGVHLHCYVTGSFQIRRHLAYRDYLVLKPEIAAQYAALKAELSLRTGR